MGYLSILQLWVSKSVLDGIKTRQSQLIKQWLIFMAFIVISNVISILTLQLTAIPGALFSKTKYFIFNYNH